MVFPRHYLVHALGRWRGNREPRRPWQPVLLVGWAGMRGGESLVIALALPLATDSGASFPGCGLIIFLTFSVILATLVLQGLSLPWVTRKLGLQHDGTAEREERAARAKMAHAALKRLDTLAENGHLSVAQRSHLGEFLARRVSAAIPQATAAGNDVSSSIARYSRALMAMVDAERQTLIRLRDEGEIGDEVMRRILRDLDLDTSLFQRVIHPVDRQSEAGNQGGRRRIRRSSESRPKTGLARASGEQDR